MEITRDEFLNLIKENVKEEGMKKPVKMIFMPARGWQYEVAAYATDAIAEPEDIFISNAFSDNESKCMKEIVEQVEAIDENLPVRFEVYGVDSNSTNEQFMTAYSNLEKIQIVEMDGQVAIYLTIDHYI